VTGANGDIYLQEELEKSTSGPNMVTSPLQVRYACQDGIGKQEHVIRMLKDECVISGKHGHELSVKKSGSFYFINCYTTKVALTEIPNSKSPRFSEDAKYSTELYLWYYPFGQLASISIKGLV
jgi:hypothetical protein